MEPLKILSSRTIKVVYAIDIYNLHIRKLNNGEYVVSTFKKIVNMEEENA